MNEINIKGKLQVKINKEWLSASLVAQDRVLDQVCVKAHKHGLVVVPYKSIRNTPETKTAGSLYRLVRDTAFDKQETDEQSATRFIDFCIKEGLTADINKV